MTRQQFARAYTNGFAQTVHFLMSRGVPAERAEEAAQAGWVRGWERRVQLHQPGRVVNWINTISLNVFRTSLRRERWTDEPVEGAAPARINASILDVRTGLAQCEPAHRRLLQAYYVSGYTSEELSRALHCSPEAVRVRVLRAKRKLIGHLKHCA